MLRQSHVPLMCWGQAVESAIKDTFPRCKCWCQKMQVAKRYFVLDVQERYKVCERENKTKAFSKVCCKVQPFHGNKCALSTATD